jgi:two-component system KDP operon response regulator KdpE
MMSLQKSTVLVVDDESSLRRALRLSLAASGFAVQEARNGGEALTAVREHQFDLVLLDIHMPGICGVDACREIRGMSPNIGIIMVSVRDMEDDKVSALEAGADDYITKPFNLRELTARLRAVLRRNRHEKQQPEILHVGNVRVDLQGRILWRGEESVHLSPIEFNLLTFMMKHPDTTLTHAKLLCAIWGPEHAGEREYLRAYIKSLRTKIEDDPAKPKYILTEAWVGYRFHNPSDPDLWFAADRKEIVSL